MMNVLLTTILLVLASFPLIGQSQTAKVEVRIFDEQGNPTAARIRLSVNDSIYLAPEGHEVDFLFGNHGGDVILDGNRRFAYIDGSFTVVAATGTTIRLEVVKGFAYKIHDSRFTVAPGSKQLDIRLEKWFSFPGKVWYSGDVHVHNIDPATALLEMKAEDVNVCNVLTSDFTTDQDRFRGAPEPRTDSLHIVYINQEYREDRLGHVNLLNLKRLIEPVKTKREFQYPLNLRGLEEARAQGGHVSWAHFAAWPGLEGPLAIVMDKVHSVELLSTIEPFSEPTFVSDVVPDLRMNSGLKIWYRLLNCGLRVPATAGTDKMSNWVTVGANRVYALTDGGLDYQRWIDALGKGRTFISNSPFIFCTLNGREPGDEIRISKGKNVTIKAEVFSQFPLDRLEIIANGEVVAEKVVTRGQTHVTLELDYQPSGSCWIAARAHQFTEPYRDSGVSFMQRREYGAGPTLLNQYFGTLRPEATFAHTSPLYLVVDGKPLRSKKDADYFVTYLENSMSWLRTSGRFPSEEAKKEVLDTFGKGQELFRRLAR